MLLWALERMAQRARFRPYWEGELPPPEHGHAVMEHTPLAERYVEPTNLEQPSPVLPQEWVTGVTLAQDAIPRQSRPSEDSMLHVSSLVDLCPRQYALARQMNVTMYRPVRAQDRVIWTMGLAAEDHVVRQFTAAHGETHMFRDQTFFVEELNLVGRPDAGIQVAQRCWAMLEVKSMNRPDFEALEAPLADHVIQAALYRWMMNNGGCPAMPGHYAHTHVILLYVCKDFTWRGDPYKEFHVDCTSERVVYQVEVALDLAEDLVDAMSATRIPPRVQCEDEECSRAKACPVAHLCFSMPEGGT